MEDSARLKLIVLGLVLAAIAGAYLFFSGRFASNKTTKIVQSSPTPVAVANNNNGTPQIVIPGNTPIRSDVPPTQPQQQQPLPQTGISGGVQKLPNTGLPEDLMGSLAAAGIVVGYAFRRFPK